MQRSRFEIHAEILSTIQRGFNKPTRIMQNTCLAWMPLTQLLQSLEDRGFVEVSFPLRADKKGRKIYSVNEKGAEFLAYFYEVKNLMESETSPELADGVRA